MSIQETNKIDIVATRPDSRVVRLVISDHLDWSDLQAHSLLLQEKVNTYIEFVESGQLMEMNNPTIPCSPEIVIAVVALHRPPQEARTFLQNVEDFLTAIGMRFEVDLSRAA